MTDPASVAPTSSATPPTAREQLRVDLLLHLPALGLRVQRAKQPAGEPSLEYPDLDLYDQVHPDHDYNPTALAAWVLEQADALVAAAFSPSLEQAEALEQQQAELVMFAGATSTFTAMAEWHSYLSQLAPVLQRNLNITEQWDLARTLEAEAARVQGVLLALLDRFPQLEAVLGEQVGMRAQGLVDKAGRDL